jgi:hypothetical protein
VVKCGFGVRVTEVSLNIFVVVSCAIYVEHVRRTSKRKLFAPIVVPCADEDITDSGLASSVVARHHSSSVSIEAGSHTLAALPSGFVSTSTPSAMLVSIRKAERFSCGALSSMRFRNNSRTL